jgi:hypothetical protein
MDVGSGDEAKGFEGLSSLVPPVNFEKVASSTSKSRQRPSGAERPKPNPQEVTSPGQPLVDGIYTGTLEIRPNRQTGKYWLVGVCVLLVLAWLGHLGDDAPGASPQATTSSGAAYPGNGPSLSPQPYFQAEVRPPIGTNLLFNAGQIRYCLSENIRIDAWRASVDEASKSSVDAFNAAIVDYNQRCSSFRYEEGAFSAVQSQVEANRATLGQEGAARALAHP